MEYIMPILLIILLSISTVFAADPSDFEQELMAVQQAFQNTDKLMEDLVNTMEGASNIKEATQAQFNRLRESIDFVADRLDENGPVYKQIDKLIEEFNFAEQEYILLYIETGDIEFQTISSEFAKLKRELLVVKEGIRRERLSTLELQYKIPSVERKALAWIRLGKAQKAVETVKQFQRTLQQANDNLEVYVNSLRSTTVNQPLNIIPGG